MQYRTVKAALPQSNGKWVAIARKMVISTNKKALAIEIQDSKTVLAMNQAIRKLGYTPIQRKISSSKWLMWKTKR